MEIVSDPRVESIINKYPLPVKNRLVQLRQLIIDTAISINSLDHIVETVKWGEPSYVTKTGSTIRMDWKPKTPDKYYLYFICSTELVNTFKVIIGEELDFEGNRAIVLKLCDPIPKVPIKRCLTLAMNYHNIKHLPLLGA